MSKGKGEGRKCANKIEIRRGKVCPSTSCRALLQSSGDILLQYVSPRLKNYCYLFLPFNHLQILLCLFRVEGGQLHVLTQRPSCSFKSVPFGKQQALQTNRIWFFVTQINLILGQTRKPVRRHWPALYHQPSQSLIL